MLVKKGEWDDGISACREALRHWPENPVAHMNLSAAQSRRGAWQEAIAAAQEALRLRPDHYNAASNLGVALLGQGKLDEAVQAFRDAVDTEPQDRTPHVNLANALTRRGDYEEAAEILREVLEQYPDAEAARLLLLECELVPRFGEPAGMLWRWLSPRTEAIYCILSARGSSAADGHRAAARWWRQAFAIWPALADDPVYRLRLQAAKAAARAGCAQGKDPPPLYQETHRLWRDQALAWLRAELDAAKARLRNAAPAAAERERDGLTRLTADAAFAALREPAGLSRLAPEERAEWQRFWADLTAALGRQP